MSGMSHSVALNFEDGVTRFIETRPNETVADASYRVGINIPLDCRDGACGTCRVFVEAGTFDGGSYIEDALTDDEAAEGYGLACQMKPHTDLVLRIAASSDVCKVKAGSAKARLASVTRLSDTTIAFALDPASPLGFLAGQYVSIQVPGTDQKRSYSFSSAPGAASLEFLVRDIPHGMMSRFLRRRHQVPRWRSAARPVASTCVTSSAPCCSSPAAPGSPRSCPCSAAWRRPGASKRSTWSTV